jgi:hypothetical protein
MEAKLIKNGNAYSLKTNGEYVAFVNEDFIGYATQEFRDNLLGKLSLKNCQAIELGYDLDELGDECQNILIKDNWRESPSQKIAFTLGFQKALEILGDKKFSEKDIAKAINFGVQIEAGNIEVDYKNYKTGENQFIQSLQQTEWDVEIVMACVIGCENLILNGENSLCCGNKKPKLDADGCIILKRKI